MTMGQREDYINPMMDGDLSWHSVCAYDIDSKATIIDDRMHSMNSQPGGVLYCRPVD